MKRAVVYVLIALNLVLIGGIAFQSGRGASVIGGSIEVVSKTNASSQIRTQFVNISNKTSLEIQWPPFRWSEIETDDYMQLAENLVRIGCPRETVRNIVESRVLDDYAEELWKEMKPLQSELWDLAATGMDFSEWEVAEEIEERVNKLESDRGAVLKTVRARIGRAPEVPQIPDLERWKFLSEEDYRMVKDLHANNHRLLAEFNRRLADLDDEDEQKAMRKQIEELEEDLTKKLKALLGEEKWGEYLKRKDGRSTWAVFVEGSDLSADKIRQVANAKAEMARQQRESAAEDENQSAKRKRLDELERAGMDLLSPEERTQLKRGRDSSYQTFLRIGRRMNLPQDVANRAYDYKQIAERQAKEIRNNKLLNDANRALAYTAFELEVTKELSTIYGDAFPVFLKYGSDWMTELFPDESVEESPPEAGDVQAQRR